MREIDTASREYDPVALRGSILFFVLNEINQIDPMYQFSLESYEGLFDLSLRNADVREEAGREDQRAERLSHLRSLQVPSSPPIPM